MMKGFDREEFDSRTEEIRALMNDSRDFGSFDCLHTAYYLSGITDRSLIDANIKRKYWKRSYDIMTRCGRPFWRLSKYRLSKERIRTPEEGALALWFSFDKGFVHAAVISCIEEDGTVRYHHKQGVSSGFRENETGQYISRYFMRLNAGVGHDSILEEDPERFRIAVPSVMIRSRILKVIAE